jgi:acetolactate synthase regulatory subunit
MHAFHIKYRNTQGTLMRILNAVSRRALDMPYVQANPAGDAHGVILVLEVNAKQIGQLCRDWHAIVDVSEVRSAVAPRDLSDLTTAWETPAHPPTEAGVRGFSASAAMA